MGEYVHYQDKDGVYWKIFASYNDSLQDLTFTSNDLDLKDENIVCIFDPIKPSDLSLHRQSKDSFQLVYQNHPLTLRKRCSYSELFWSAFSRIWTEYEEIHSRNCNLNNNLY